MLKNVVGYVTPRKGTPKPKPAYNEIRLTNKLHQKAIVQHVNSIDWAVGSDAPIVVEFDPTTACNLHCPDCISGDLLNQGAFERKRIREITKEMVDAGVKAVILIGGGEPLSHPEIGWIIEYLGTHGVKIGITTNGILINRYMEEIAEQLAREQGPPSPGIPWRAPDWYIQAVSGGMGPIGVWKGYLELLQLGLVDRPVDRGYSSSPLPTDALLHGFDAEDAESATADEGDSGALQG